MAADRPNQSDDQATPRSEVSATQAAERAKKRVSQFFAELGPGLITGCADDDPSGISTYSVAGAALGYSLLWTALLSLPLMAAVQLMCGRLGMVTGRGLADIIRLQYPRWVLWGTCLSLMVANIFNIGADLSGMGTAAELVTGIKSFVWTPVMTAVIVGSLFWFSYQRLASIFKWITLVLLAYIGAAFFAHVQWHSALVATVSPRLSFSRQSLTIFVAILGTTISPYLFFWQASQEVEEERSRGRNVRRRPGASDNALRRLRTDVLTGMVASNVIMYFIILSTAATLHANGSTDIQTAKQAAESLRPLAGDAAYWLFTVGLIGTGMLGVPVLAGSCAYTMAEAAGWRGSLENKPRKAREFYAVLTGAMIIGLGINAAGQDAVKMLFWSAVINGALAPPLILVIVLLTSNPRVMGARANSPLLQCLGWITFALMSAATLGMLWT